MGAIVGDASAGDAVLAGAGAGAADADAGAAGAGDLDAFAGALGAPAGTDADDCARAAPGTSATPLANATNRVLNEGIGNFESIPKTTTTYRGRVGLLAHSTRRGNARANADIIPSF